MTHSSAGNRIEIVHCLRGLAALAVCWFHFTNGNETFLKPGLLKQSGAYGWLGVEVFFVISGFILPYALHASGYRLNLTTYRQFITKRIIRLDPPYLATIALVIALGYLPALVPGHRGSQPDINLLRLAAHLGYMCGILKVDWLLPVFWTLAIEFQFYLAIALLYPLVVSRHTPTRLVTLCSLAALSLIPSANTVIFHYLFLFVTGIVTFHARVKLSRPVESIAGLIVCAIGAVWTMGFVVAAVGLGTACAILTIQWQSRILHALGTLSYSLYLVHVPIGDTIINIADKRLTGLVYRVATLALAMAATLIASYAMYRFVERPSQAYAGRIRFRRDAKEPKVAVRAPQVTESMPVQGRE